MPNPLNRRTNQQWRTCDRCDDLYPMSKLSVQKGMIVCFKCTDDLTVERRPAIIGALFAQPFTEGADLRAVDLAFNPTNELL